MACPTGACQHRPRDPRASALTKTDATDPVIWAAVGRGKKNSNRAQPTDGQPASPNPPADQDSDVMSVESIEESDGDSDYVELAIMLPKTLAAELIEALLREALL